MTNFMHTLIIFSVNFYVASLRLTQHALFRLFQEWQSKLDSERFLGTVLMNLFKTYDYLPPNLLITKLEAYGLHYNGLTFMLDYLTSRKQRTKIDNSNRTESFPGIPQG